MKNIRLFEEASQYEAIKDTFEFPTVSYCVDTDEVHYMIQTPSFITFYIEDCEYTASTVMTWDEWISTSELMDRDASCVGYGCDNYWHINQQNEVIADLAEEMFCIQRGYIYPTKDGVRVLGADMIVPNYRYECQRVGL